MYVPRHLQGAESPPPPPPPPPFFLILGETLIPSIGMGTVLCGMPRTQVHMVEGFICDQNKRFHSRPININHHGRLHRFISRLLLCCVCTCPGCLLQYIRNRKELAEKNEVMLDMALQICSAMTCLEANGFIHRDLVSQPYPPLLQCYIQWFPQRRKGAQHPPPPFYCVHADNSII